MKNFIVFMLLLMPVMAISQDFDESFDKIQTLKWINSNIKPTGNTYNLSSLKTNAVYTENFFDKNATATYKFDLAKVSVTTVGNKVRLTCTSADCIEYTYASPTTTETKKLKTLDLEAKGQIGDLYRAILTLKKRVGIL